MISSMPSESMPSSLMLVVSATLGKSFSATSVAVRLKDLEKLCSTVRHD